MVCLNPNFALYGSNNIVYSLDIICLVFLGYYLIFFATTLVFQIFMCFEAGYVPWVNMVNLKFLQNHLTLLQEILYLES